MCRQSIYRTATRQMSCNRPLLENAPHVPETHPWQTGTTPRTPTDVPTEGHTARRSVSPYKTRYLEGLHSPAAQLELEQTLSSGSQRTPSPLAKDTRREPVTFPGDSSSQPQTVTPPSDLLPSMYNVKQGDGARQNAIESPPPAPLTEGDVSILTTSSSGTSADDNPWLFESVARALGPRSTSADMESLSGKSVKSTKSGKSWRSHRSSQEPWEVAKDARGEREAALEVEVVNERAFRLVLPVTTRALLTFPWLRGVSRTT